MNRLAINRIIAQMVISAWLAGWFIKAAFYFPYLSSVIWTHSIGHTHFPHIFTMPEVAMTVYFLPVVACFCFFSRRQMIYQLASSLLLICAVIMNLHIDTHNDATFVTSSWVALWLLWFTAHMHRTDQDFVRHGRYLAQCLISMIFFAGVIGKLTPEYWQGTVLQQIFLAQSTGSPIKIVMGMLPAVGQAPVITWISWMVIFVEGGLALAVFFPYRWVGIGAPAMMLMILVFSTWRILSVLSAPAGMLLACLLWQSRWDFKRV
jgi:hypothetical protein